MSRPVNILLLGAGGQLGKVLTADLPTIGRIHALDRASLDITNHHAVAEAVTDTQANIIVNAAAYTAVDKAEGEAKKAHAINADAVANLAQLAKTQGAWLIHYSSDYVFDGSKPTPYVEADSPNPINIYGASKLAGEQAIVNSGCRHLIFRTSWVIGKDGSSFAKTILRLATEQYSLQVVSDQRGVPTSPSLISNITLDAIRAIATGQAWPAGLYHLTPSGTSNWHEIAQTLLEHAERAHIPLSARAKDVQSITTADYPTAAKRPLNSQLDTQKLRAQLSFDLPHWQTDFLTVAGDIIKEWQTA